MRVIAFDVGVKNLAYCDVSCNMMIKSNDVFQHLDVNDMQVISLIQKDEKVNRTSLDTLATNLFKELERFNGIHYDVVLIENQPVNKNPLMKSIQMMIYSHFHIKKKNEKSETNIKLLSPINKTKVLNYFDDSVVNTITSQLTLSSKYSNTKRMATLLTEHILSLCPENSFLADFKTLKKKDDLSDAFLMTVYFLVAF